MPEYIETFRKKLHNHQDSLVEQEDRKRELMEEAREYFGYHVDPGDPRFVRMQEQKREEKQKQRKKLKKEMKTANEQKALKKMVEEVKKESEQFELQ